MLDRNFFDASSGRAGVDDFFVGVAVSGLAEVVVTPSTELVALCVCILSSSVVESDFRFLLCFFRELFTASSLSSLSSLMLFERLVFVFPTVIASSISAFSFDFVLFDFDFFLLSFTRGNTLNPVRDSMNRHTISISCLIGNGIDDDARIDFRMHCIALLFLEDEDAPPRMASTELRWDLGGMTPCEFDDIFLR